MKKSSKPTYFITFIVQAIAKSEGYFKEPIKKWTRSLLRCNEINTDTGMCE